MKNIIHRAETRGLAEHGWLLSRHTFSFADYYNPERMNFGALRVLNDDIIQGGMGFDTHPHRNMEIISIPMEGALEHKDSMGHTNIIEYNDIQVMSAGTGILHSEYNKNSDKFGKFLQIWVLPNKMNIIPRYDQISLKTEDRHNKLQQIISPNNNNDGLWIYQDAWIYLGKFDKDMSFEYKLNSESNGVYIFIIDGIVDINNINLFKRDGLGIWETDKLIINSKSESEILLIEIPMNIKIK